MRNENTHISITEIKKLSKEQLETAIYECNRQLSFFEKLGGKETYTFKYPGGIDYKFYLDLKSKFVTVVRERSLDNLID